jgi:hypothetical protein
MSIAQERPQVQGEAPTRSRVLHIVLWVVQVLLALLFVMVGTM